MTSQWRAGADADALDSAFCALARPGMTVLDAGCGGVRGCSRKAPWQELTIVGVDSDPAVLTNPFCNERHVARLEHIPMQAEKIDVIHCRWVLEHLAEPAAVFREFARVLKRGGRLLALTPNLWHYATFVSRVTPGWFHKWWWRGRYEPFPTYYRANTRRVLRMLCARAGLVVEHIEAIEGPPTYLACWRPAYCGGVLYQRAVNGSPLFAGLRQRLLLQALKAGPRA